MFEMFETLAFLFAYGYRIIQTGFILMRLGVGISGRGVMI